MRILKFIWDWIEVFLALASIALAIIALNL